MILAIFCAGNLGRELHDIAARINERSNTWNKIVFVDDIYLQKEFYGSEVYRLDDFLQQDKENIEFVIANGEPINREKIYQRLVENNFCIGKLIDPTAIISPTAQLGKGVIITPYSAISSNAILEDNVLIHSYVRVGHDIEVKKHSVLSSNVGIGGRTCVGQKTYVGMGAVIRENINIGENVIISMGAVVHTNMADGVIAVGNPARVMKKNTEGRIF